MKDFSVACFMVSRHSNVINNYVRYESYGTLQSPIFVICSIIITLYTLFGSELDNCIN